MKTYSISPDFIKEVSRNEDLLNELKNDPVKVLEENARAPWENDIWIYRIVIGALSTLIILCSIFYFLLSQSPGLQIPPSLVALGSASLGALTGLLAPSPAARN